MTLKTSEVVYVSNGSVDTSGLVEQSTYATDKAALEQVVVDRIPKTKIVEYFADCLTGDFTGYDWVETRAHHSYFSGGAAKYYRTGEVSTPNTGDEAMWYDSAGNEFVLNPHRVFIESFGAEKNNIAVDHGPILVNALNFTAGRCPLYASSGTYYCSTVADITHITETVVIIGEASSLTTLRGVTDDVGILRRASTAATNINMHISGVEFYGPWEDGTASAKEGLDTAWLANLFGLDKLVLSDVRARSSQKGGIKARALSVVAEKLEFYELARGGFNVVGSKRVSINGLKGSHVRDDIVSLQIASAGVLLENFYLNDVDLFDCQGIVVNGCRNWQVTNIRFNLQRGRLLFLAYDSTFNEGTASNINGIVNGVTGTDLIAKDFFEAGDLYNLINIVPYLPSDGGILQAAPGEANGVDGIVPFYGNNANYGDASTTVIAGCWNILILNISCSRTQAAGNYSSFGYGNYFMPTGYQDGAVSDNQLSWRGLVLGAGVNNCLISDSVIRPGRQGLFLDTRNTSIGWRDVKLSNVTLTDCQGGVVTTNASSADYPVRADITFDSCTFDGDPFMRHGSRNADGSWASQTALTALILVYLKGIQFTGKNTVKNVSRIISVSGGGSQTRYYCHSPIVQQGDVDTLGYSSTNKGIGTVHACDSRFTYEPIYSDPSDTEYGTLIRKYNSAENDIPSSGNYIEGEFIENISASRYQPDTGKLTKGWRRITTGGGHVLDTDWAVVFESVT